MHHPDLLDGTRLTSIALATVIGGVTATGSMIAFGKLNGNLDSSRCLAMRDQLNIGMGVATLGCMGLFISQPGPHGASMLALAACPALARSDCT